MFDLFRFILQRPAELSENSSIISTDGNTEFQLQLRNARVGDEPLAEMKRLANEFIKGTMFVRITSSLNYNKELILLNTILTKKQPSNLDSFKQAITQSFTQRPVNVVVQDSKFQQDKQRLFDSLIAAKIGNPPEEEQLYLIAQNIRLVSLIERVAKDDVSLNRLEALKIIFQEPITMPIGLLPLPLPQKNGTDNVSEKMSQQIDGRKIRKEVDNFYDQLTELYNFLMTIEPNELSEVQPAPMLPTEHSEKTNLLFGDEASQFSNWTIHKKIPENLTVKSSTIEKMSLKTHQVLGRLGIDLARTPLSIAIEIVSNELSGLSSQVDDIKQNGSNVVRVGSNLYPMNSLIDLTTSGVNLLANIPPLPSTHGSVKPIGIGDLIVVKEQIIGYEKGEVASIENILKGETHSRTFSRSERTEDTTVSKTENISEEERDLQTTDRFEMRRESEQVANMDGDLRSPTYGGLLEFDTNNQPVHGSKQMAESQATTYGKNVMSRAVSKITESVSTQEIHRTVREFNEKTSHEFNNKEGTKNVNAVYQWVDKVYQGQAYNYGKRLLYDIVVPEPGAFLLQAFARDQAEGKELIKPKPFTIPPDEITDINYLDYIAQYNVTGVEPPLRIICQHVRRIKPWNQI
ncbi:hypothetical protein A9498_10050 [Bacillus thuringiensis serovar coreanensis]|nr:hypothetical protein A9498_10050 [Bacillus thuringiensis serovar coreanensis]